MIHDGRLEVRLPQDLYDKIEALAQRDGLNVSTWARSALARQVRYAERR